MAAITCGRCGGKVSFAMALPVFITFNDEGTVATITTDVSEVDDWSDLDLTCACTATDDPDDAEIEDEESDRLTAMLTTIKEKAAPSLDVEVA